MKRLAILGSTGSIGRQTLDVVRAHPDLFDVAALSTKSNVELLARQIEQFRPEAVAVADPEAAKEMPDVDCEVLVGPQGIADLASMDGVDLVLNALVGSAGLKPTLSAIETGKTLALANKESLVVGGHLVKEEMEKSGASLIPVDSEHSAIFQCLLGEDRGGLSRIILTASGGPFRGRKASELTDVTVDEALAHPRWKMGPKITVDSATMMNKGLEVIEAHHLFGIDFDEIEIVIHPESIVHSLVEFVDGSVKAQLGATDMRLPIQYALTHPNRLPSPVSRIDLAQLGALTFEKPDVEGFPALALAIESGRRGGASPAIANAANEEAVDAFLNGQIRFTDIPAVIEGTLESVRGKRADSFDILMEVEAEARAKAKERIEVLRSTAD